MTQPRGLRAFASRNRDSLMLELIGGVILASAVSLVIFFAESASEQSRNDHAESLGNSLFVREAVMNQSTTLPFSSLYLEGAQLSGLALDGADFSDAALAGAELKGSGLAGASLAEADLTGADLSRADLTGADLTEATLADADLTGAVLNDVTHDEADFSGAWYLDEEPPEAADEILAQLTAVDAAEADRDDD